MPQHVIKPYVVNKRNQICLTSYVLQLTESKMHVQLFQNESTLIVDHKKTETKILYFRLICSHRYLELHAPTYIN